MSVKMKRENMVVLWNLLNKLSQENLPGRIFKIFVAKNILVLKPEIEMIQETFKSPAGAQEYENKKRDILLKYADRDGNGAVIFEGTNFKVTVPENVEKVREEIKELDKENAELVKEIEEINRELLEFLKQDVEFNLMKVTEDGIPDNISTTDLTVIVELGLLV